MNTRTYTIEVLREDGWRVLTTISPESAGKHFETAERTLTRAQRMLNRWADTYWQTQGEFATLRLV